jgi:hypothetical protein
VLLPLIAIIIKSLRNPAKDPAAATPREASS